MSNFCGGRKYTVDDCLGFINRTFYEFGVERGLTFDMQYDSTKIIGHAAVLDYDVLCNKDCITAIFGTIGSAESCVDDSMFVSCVVSCFHELAHVDQALSIKDSGIGDGLLHLGRIVDLNNSRHYVQYYKQNVRELCAERSGLYQAGLLLQNYYSDDQTEQLLLDYVNSKTNDLFFGRGKYWLDQSTDTKSGKYESLDLVIQAFDDAIEHVYVSQPYRTNELDYANDEFLRVVGSSIQGDVKNPWYNVWNSLQNSESDNVMDSFKKIASVAVHVHSEYKDQFACLKYIDLSPEVVFGESFKESSFDVRCRLGLETKPGLSGLVSKFQKDRDLKQDFKNRDKRDREQVSILQKSSSVRKTNALLDFEPVIGNRVIESDDFEFG